MDNFIVYNGVDSRLLKLHIEVLPPKVSPKLRYTTTTVPGMHGVLTETDGTYESYSRSVEFTTLDLTKLDEICSVFKNAGWVIFSNEPNRKYMARVSNAIELTQIIRVWRRFIVQFEIQPFGYEVNPQNFTAVNNSTIINYGTFESQPKITIYGTGTFTLNVNGQAMIFSGITNKIIIDSETQNAYDGTTLLNQKVNGEFPVFNVGENKMSWTGNITKVEIEPNWRWL